MTESDLRPEGFCLIEKIENSNLSVEGHTSSSLQLQTEAEIPPLIQYNKIFQPLSFFSQIIYLSLLSIPQAATGIKKSFSCFKKGFLPDFYIFSLQSCYEMLKPSAQLITIFLIS